MPKKKCTSVLEHEHQAIHKLVTAMSVVSTNWMQGKRSIPQSCTISPTTAIT